MRNPKLRFRKDGTFKILQLTDVHGICKKTPDTSRLIEGVLDQEKPDLVVITGDQIKGYGLSYLHGDKHKKVEQAIDNYTEPIDRRGIPFAVTFGNHDPQVGYSTAEQMKMYEVFDSCIIPDEELSYGPGTFSLPIYGSESEEPAVNLYMIDSGGSAPEGGYQSVETEKIDWYRAVREKLHEKWGRYVPSMVFQHIPVHEIYNLFDEVDKKHPDAVKTYRIHKGQFFKLKDEFVHDDVKLYEPASISDVNTGEFDALTEKGEVFAMYFGHDHQNNFVGNYKGVDMGYGPSCGFNEYGNGVERGCRIIELNEKDIRKYRTYVVTYRQLFGKKVIKPFQKSFYDKIPTSVDAGVVAGSKLLACLAVIIVSLCLPIPPLVKALLCAGGIAGIAFVIARL
ncbi:MAG: metallophosphoesterase family protein [Clostridia bacterium]|nr:metallophosphoesterase family protein [Clostridia bacterium]